MTHQIRDLIPIFVYGTLKTGFPNHFRFCQGVRKVKAAWLYGKMYDMGWGYPLLELPLERVLVQGTTNIPADSSLKIDRVDPEIQQLDTSWPRIFGELMFFDDLPQRLAKLDFLEGFNGGQNSLYLRVLTSVWVEGDSQSHPAWCYIVGPNTLDARARRIETWP